MAELLGIGSGIWGLNPAGPKFNLLTFEVQVKVDTLSSVDPEIDALPETIATN